jgi:hypothetical protein
MRTHASWSILLANALVTAALIGAYALWLAPQPRFALLDVGELYRLKESRIAAVLVKPDSGEAQRLAALEEAAAFGDALNGLIEALPGECRCLILARGAVVGNPESLPDLTPEVRRRLGL